MNFLQYVKQTLLVSTFLISTNVFGQIETVATFDSNYPPGNIAISKEGRIFMSVHPFYGKDVRVVEVLENGIVRPYPDALWSSSPIKDGPGLTQVLGLNVDEKGILWLLDGQSATHSAKLVGWNIKENRLDTLIYLAAPVVRQDSFLNDLAIDRDNDAIYISDVSTPTTSAIIVVDLTTGRARRVLEGSKYTVPEDLEMKVDDKVLSLGGHAAKIGVNPITVDDRNQWVYFAPMTGLSMYRVRTADLLDDTLYTPELETRVERYGDKPISDGSTIDRDGNVYITSITDDSIGVVQKNGEYQQLYQRDDLSWPDGFAVGPDDYIYLTVNELHRSPVLAGKDESLGEFKIVRFPALAKTRIGR